MRARKTVSMDDLDKRLHEKSPDTQLTTEQAAIVMGCGVSTLEKKRKQERPPPYRRDGKSIRYRLGDLLAITRDTGFGPPSDAHAAPASNEADYSSLSSFLDTARINDVWPFTIIAGKPVDFFASLEQDVSDEAVCQWLTLGEYLKERRAWAEHQPRVEEQAGLAKGARKLGDPPPPPKPPL